MRVMKQSFALGEARTILVRVEMIDPPPPILPCDHFLLVRHPYQREVRLAVRIANVKTALPVEDSQKQ